MPVSLTSGLQAAVAALLIGALRMYKDRGGRSGVLPVDTAISQA